MTTDNNDIQRDPFEALAAEFTERCRRGEQPSVESYAAQHPDLADDIRELFSTIREVEQAKGAMSSSGHARAVIGPSIERLGDFRIIRELGHGGMGIVYEAEQESLGRRVAIKVLPHLYLRSASRRERFERESRTAAKLHHTNIVPVFGVGEQDGYPYFVMQYIRGVSLDRVFQHLHAENTRLARTAPASGGSSAAAFEFERIARSLLSSCLAEHTVTAGGEGEIAQDGQLSPALPLSVSPSPSPPSEPHPDTQRPLTLAYWRHLGRLMAEAADALAYAHSQGVLHRDIKPSNLLLDADGTLWVTDFGLAKVIESDKDASLTQAGDVVGTLRYMSPEQYARRGDERSDVYGLGVTLYELATLQPAFTDLDRSSLSRLVLDPSAGGLWPPRRHCPSMPRDFETIIEKAAAREAAHRYASAAALRDDLLRFADDQPILARRVSIPERMWRWSRRNPALAATSGAVMALLLTIAIVASSAYLHVRRANLRTSDALAGETQQRQRAQATADLAVEALDTLFSEFAPESAMVSGEFKLDETESGSVSVAVPPVLSDDTARLLEPMLAFYGRLAHQEGGSRELRLKMAAAQRRVGEIQERLGQYDEARRAYSESIRQYEQLLDGAGSPPHGHGSDRDDVLLVLVRLHEQLGQVFAMQDQAVEATAQIEVAQELLERYPEPARSSPQLRFELARTHYLMGLPPGGALALQPEMSRPPGPGGPLGFGPQGPPEGRGPGARLLAPAGEGDGPRLRGPDPNGPGRLHQPMGREGSGLRPPLTPGSAGPPDRGGPRRRRAGPRAFGPEPDGPPGDPASDPQPPEEDRAADRTDRIRRHEHLGQAIVILTELTDAAPQVPAYRHLLALCLRQRRPTPPALVRPVAPAGDLDQAIRLLEGLVQEFPDVPQYTLDLCQAYAARPPRPQQEGDQDQLKQAVERMEKLTRERPGIPSYSFALAQLYVRMSLEDRADHLPQRAIQDLRRAIELQAALVEKFPSVTAYMLAIAWSERELAGMLMPVGQWEQAETNASSAIRRLTPLASGEDVRPPVRHLLGMCYEQLARCLRARGADQEAVEAEGEAMWYRRPLAPTTRPGFETVTP